MLARQLNAVVRDVTCSLVLCEEEETCMSHEDEDTCMSHEEEDTCMSYEEEETCMSYEEEDTNGREGSHLLS